MSINNFDNLEICKNINIDHDISKKLNYTNINGFYPFIFCNCDNNIAKIGHKLFIEVILFFDCMGYIIAPIEKETIFSFGNKTVSKKEQLYQMHNNATSLKINIFKDEKTGYEEWKIEHTKYITENNGVFEKDTESRCFKSYNNADELLLNVMHNNSNNKILKKFIRILWGFRNVESSSEILRNRISKRFY